MTGPFLWTSENTHRVVRCHFTPSDLHFRIRAERVPILAAIELNDAHWMSSAICIPVEQNEIKMTQCCDLWIKNNISSGCWYFTAENIPPGHTPGMTGLESLAHTQWYGSPVWDWVNLRGLIEGMPLESTELAYQQRLGHNLLPKQRQHSAFLAHSLSYRYRRNILFVCSCIA